MPADSKQSATTSVNVLSPLVVAQPPAPVTKQRARELYAEACRDARALDPPAVDIGKLGGYTFGFDRCVRRRGVSKYGPRSITISEHLLKLGEAEARMTIRHEVAHAIAGPNEHHSDVWRDVFRRLGGNGQRCGHSMQVPHKWVYRCPHGHQFKRHKRLALRKKWVCNRCQGVLTCSRL